FKNRAEGRGKRSADCSPLEGRRVRPSAGRVRRTGESCGPGDCGTLLGKTFSRMLSGICGSAALGSVLAHDIGDEPAAVLEMVRGRQAERLLQLRRPASRKVQKQSGSPLCSRARK